MQSGITASQDLHAAFSTFLTSSEFALPVTIQGESLVPLEPIPFSSSSSSDFYSSLPSLTSHLDPKQPIYLLLRKSPTLKSFTAITYVPSTAPVRAKTLIASTRASLVRELGLEKFDETLFVTDKEEVLEVSAWEERAREKRGEVDVNLLSREERELQSVKRAEEEARHGTQGTALGGMGGGEYDIGGGVKDGQDRHGVAMKITDEARGALQGFARSANEGFVQFSIDVSTETLQLVGQEDSSAGVPPGALAAAIPSGKPSYTFYRHPQAAGAEAETALFIYVCPGSSKVKERMIHASSRSAVLNLAKAEGVVVSKRLEAGDADEITEERLAEEIGVDASSNPGSGAATPSGAGGRPGFARPKRPGRK